MSNGCGWVAWIALAGFCASPGCLDFEGDVSPSRSSSNASGSRTRQVGRPKVGKDVPGGSAGIAGAPSAGPIQAVGGFPPDPGIAVGGAAGIATSAGAAGATPCPGKGGPNMVLLPEGYCIDSTEVTRAQYAAWLATGPSTQGQSSDCTWNTSFAPAASCLNWTAVCRSSCDSHPQVCVDWCDAYAYCQAMGKRLCGKIGGGWSTWSDYADTSLSEWYNACTSHGANAYPYGSTYDGELCNGADHAGTTNMTVAVQSMVSCHSSIPGYEGVFDLNGNVMEWESACGGIGRLAFCRIRGGSIYTGANTSCDIDFFNSRNYANEGIGLRCCSTP